MKAASRCNEGVLSGKLAGPCPDGKAATAIAKAQLKLRSAIDKKCGGPDRVCGFGTDEPLASIGWDIATCPNFEHGTCSNTIADCGDIADCLLCVGEAAVDQAVDLYYEELATSTDSAVQRCQREIGRSATGAFRAETKALQKCADAGLRGAGSGSCPDGKTAASLARARSTSVAKMCQACGGFDAACGGGGDLTPAAIGFRATCPAVTIPGGTACGGPVSDLSALVACVSCVTSFKADCTDALAVPSLEPYPAACNADPGATPTPGGGPTPTPTPSLCGNGVVDGGEDCDGANAAACPGECTASCRCPAARRPHPLGPLPRARGRARLAGPGSGGHEPELPAGPRFRLGVDRHHRRRALYQQCALRRGPPGQLQLRSRLADVRAVRRRRHRAVPRPPEKLPLLQSRRPRRELACDLRSRGAELRGRGDLRMLQRPDPARVVGGRAGLHRQPLHRGAHRHRERIAHGPACR